MSWIRPRFLLALLALLLLVPACPKTGDSGSGDKDKKDNKEAKKDSPETKTVRVRVSPLAKGPIASLIETTSTVEAESTVDIYSKLGGILAMVLVEEGTLVRPDTVLAKIDATEYRLRESQAEVAYREALQQQKQSALAKEETENREKQARRAADQAKRDYERSKNLDAASSADKQSLISKKDLEASKLAWDKAEGEWEVARFSARKAGVETESTSITTEKLKIAWDIAKLQVHDTEIRARVDGIVSFRGVRTGETVTPSTKAFTVVDLEHLQTNFFRPQKELRFLAKGIPLEATSESFADVKFSGTVLRVNPVVDPASGTFKVTARLDNPENLLRPGMLIRTKITTATHDEAYLVPKKAVFWDGDRPIVFAVREGVAVRVTLDQGFSDPERIEVLNINDAGLRPGDKIIVIGNAELRDGAKVEVVEG